MRRCRWPRTRCFVALADKIARCVAEQGETSPAPEAIQAAQSPADAGKTISDIMTEVYGKLRETMKLGVCRKVTGNFLASYVHHDGKSGVLLALDAKPTEDNVALDLCHHATFSRPMAINRDDIPADRYREGAQPVPRDRPERG